MEKNPTLSLKLGGGVGKNNVLDIGVIGRSSNGIITVGTADCYVCPLRKKDTDSFVSNY